MSEYYIREGRLLCGRGRRLDGRGPVPWRRRRRRAERPLVKNRGRARKRHSGHGVEEDANAAVDPPWQRWKRRVLPTESHHGAAAPTVSFSVDPPDRTGKTYVRAARNGLLTSTEWKVDVVSATHWPPRPRLNHAAALLREAPRDVSRVLCIHVSCYMTTQKQN